MIFLLNLIGFLIEMIVCPVLMIPFLLWRLLVSIQFSNPEEKEEEDDTTSDLNKMVPSIGAYQLLQKAS